ncbi:MAG: DUF4157 domain-containing protein [Rhodospirillales bacterium]|nr:DUF4157 domain-containing protein [Rhodospirillales bacterium]
MKIVSAIFAWLARIYVPRWAGRRLEIGLRAGCVLVAILPAIAAEAASLSEREPYAIERRAGQPDPNAVQSRDPTPALRAWVDDLTGVGMSAWTQVKERSVAFGAPLLAREIVAWRSEALVDGVAPMPAAIRRSLRGFFPDDLLNRVRYRIGWSAPRSLKSTAFDMLDTRAIALSDIVVFRDAAVSQDAAIWAHELRHVQQYDQWGIEGFAKHYVADSQVVEDNAWQETARFRMWVLEHTGKVYGTEAASLTP